MSLVSNMEATTSAVTWDRILTYDVTWAVIIRTNIDSIIESRRFSSYKFAEDWAKSIMLNRQTAYCNNMSIIEREGVIRSNGIHGPFKETGKRWHLILNGDTVEIQTEVMGWSRES